ncbi:MAG: ATP-binding protein [Chloroflexi bacterium]|nr:ATP-binding protein [Chloroflexota bacterium]
MTTNQSGGANFDKSKVEVNRDVVGHDSIGEQHNYYTAPTPQRKAELPNQPYFFGREEELETIKDALAPENRSWGALIDGPGGIGKTALAIRAGHLAPEGNFKTKIFLSAKVRDLTPQGEEKLEDFMLPNYIALLSELARELGEDDIAKIPENERANTVRRLLSDRYALIIIDNLETFTETERKRVFQFLGRLPSSCKAIVTSRRRTDVDARIVRLERLSREAAMNFIAELAKSKNNKHLARATQEERDKLYDTSGGNPLIIKWIAGQLGRKGSKCRTIDDACKFIENAPKDNAPLEYIFGDIVGTLAKSEVVTLATISLFEQPIEKKWVAKIANIASSEIKTILEDLLDQDLLTVDNLGEHYFTPPLFSSFFKRRYPEIIKPMRGRLFGIKTIGLGNMADGDYELATESYKDALDLWRTLSPENKDVADILNDLGTARHNLKDYATAIAKALLKLDRQVEGITYADRAVDIFRDLGIRDDLEIAQMVLKEYQH